MEHLTHTISGRAYRIGAALPGLGDGYHIGYEGARELLVRLAPTNTPQLVALSTEARLIASLAHPRIAGLYDLGDTDDYACMLLDSAPERPLAELIQHTELSVTAALDVLLQVAEVLQGLHQAGLAWGRLRPHAFMIDRAGWLKLINLRGIGESIFVCPLSLAEAIYLAPEQSAGQPPTSSSDIYGCGVLAYELLGGRTPFVGTSPSELAVKHLSDEPPDLRGIRPDLPPALAALVAGCLRKAPAERPADVAELAAALRAIQQVTQAADQAQRVICPRCQGKIVPSQRCPLCNALLIPDAPAAPPERPRKRRRLPVLLMPLVGLAILYVLFHAVGAKGSQSHTATATPAPSALPTTPTATPLPTLLPTATAVPAALGAIDAPAADVADSNIDIIHARVFSETGTLTAEISVAGQIYQEPNQALYQVLIGGAQPQQGQETVWSDLRASYTILYRSGDAEGMLLAWDGDTWQGIGAARRSIQGGVLTLRIPSEWLPSGPLRYGVLASNPAANLTDYAPVRGQVSAHVASE